MTVETTTNTQVARGNGATTSWPFGFKVLDATHLVIQRRVFATGVIDKTYSLSEVTVTGVGDAAGGTVEITPALSDTYEVIISRTVPYTQELDIVNQGGFFPDTVEQQLDLLEMQIQQISDKADRAIIVPTGEAGGSLPIKALRANKFATFDSAGDPSVADGAAPVPNTAVNIVSDGPSTVQADLNARPTSAALAASGGAALVGALQAGTGAVDRTVQSKLRDIVSVKDFGAVGDGTTDDTAAFANALAALSAIGGGVLTAPKANYALASATLANGLQIPANTTIDLGGSTLTITGTAIVGGSTTGALFEATNVSNVTIRNGIVIGNSEADNYNNGAFLNCKLTSTATADMTNIRVENVEMQNFKANWWLLVHNANASHEIVTVRLTDIRAISAPGNSQNPAAIGYNAYAIMVFGETNYIKDVVVSAPYVEATYIKGGVTFKDYVLDGIIRNATILSAGATGGADDSGSYAIGCYNSGASMGNITIESPTIHAPRDCGIYAASADRLSIVNPRINGQTSTADTSLPKGAIALNSCTNVSIESGGLEDNWTDLMIVAHVANQNITVSGLRCTGSGEATGHTGGALCVKPSIAGASGYAFADCLFDTANGARAVFVANRAATYVSDLTFDTCRIVGRVTFGLDLNAYGEASPGDDIRLLNCYLAGANTALRATQATGYVQIQGCEFADVGGATALLAQVDSSTKIDLTNSRFRNMGAGYAISASGTVGIIDGMFFHNIANVAQAGSIGLAKPTHSGELGHIIQNLAPVATAYSKWMCMGTTTWKGVGLIET